MTFAAPRYTMGAVQLLEKQLGTGEKPSERKQPHTAL